MDAIKIISQNVGQTVSRIIENTDERLLENAREIRLFAGRPLRIVNGEGGFFIGRVLPVRQSLFFRLFPPRRPLFLLQFEY